MAKSTSFFGLRRGSTKSLTFQVLNGQQVTKDRVTEISNPQTVAQMRQRIVFGTVTKAAASLTDIIGISFQGVTKVAASKRKFISVNSIKLGEALRNNLAEGTYSPKGQSVLVANKYIISQGSASNATLGALSVTNGAINNGSVNYGFEVGVSYTPSEMLATLFGCEPGDQITLVGIAEQGAVEYYPATYEILRDGEMMAARVIFKNLAQLASVDNFTVASTDTADTIAEKLMMYAKTLIAGGSQRFVNAITDTDNFDVTVGTGDAAGNISVIYTVGEGDSLNSLITVFPEWKRVMAAGYFRSSYNEASKMWRFSTCELTVISPEYTAETYNGDQPINYGYDFNTALKSYDSATAKEFTRYTETGGSIDNLGF